MTTVVCLLDTICPHIFQFGTYLAGHFLPHMILLLMYDDFTIKWPLDEEKKENNKHYSLILYPGDGRGDTVGIACSCCGLR